MGNGSGMKLLMAGAALVSLLGGGCGGPDPAAGPADAPGAGWLVHDEAASCLEEFTVENLAERSWAFDGTIAEVVPPEDPDGDKPADIVTKVTFDVNRWYKGGQADTITVLTYSSPGTTSSAEEVHPSTGARILASGEDRYLWGCGFSMPYTEDNARTFERAFAG